MRLQSLVYRAHNPRWSFAPTSGEGAARHGGRFDPVGMPALYTSATLEGAWREARQGFAFKAQPLLICVYEVDCEDVADLCGTGCRTALVFWHWSDTLPHHVRVIDDDRRLPKDASSWRLQQTSADVDGIP